MFFCSYNFDIYITQSNRCAIVALALAARSCIVYLLYAGARDCHKVKRAYNFQGICLVCIIPCMYVYVKAIYCKRVNKVAARNYFFLYVSFTFSYFSQFFLHVLSRAASYIINVPKIFLTIAPRSINTLTYFTVAFYALKQKKNIQDSPLF